MRGVAETTNIFNASSGLSQAMQLKLAIMALTGNSPVSTFVDIAAAQGLTPEAKEKKEREERLFWRHLEELHERQQKFLERLDRLNVAAAEALRENGEKLRDAREKLDDIRERAYKITMPDGTVVSVFRDGDKVRNETGALVSPDIVRAEDLPVSASTWEDRMAAGKAVDDLQREHNAIVKYQQTLDDTQKKAASGDLSADELDALKRNVQSTMPDSVRRQYGAAYPDDPLPPPDDTASGPNLSRPFTAAAMGDDPDPANDTAPEEIRRPAVSAPGLK
jgi:hypothetical protein